MRITYLIGNGFDLQMGMPTSYLDFYRYKQYSYNPNNVIYKSIFQDGFKKWVDFEVSLGKLTKKISIEESEKFIDDLWELFDDLNAYLNIIEEEYTKVELESTTDLFQETIDNITQGLRRNDEKLIEEFFTTRNNEYISVSFISYNYTRSLDRLRDMSSDNITNHLTSSNYSSISLNGVNHVHGTLFEGLTLGVNDRSQVNDKLSDEFYENVVKPEMSARDKRGVDQVVEEILKDTQIYVIFGLSLGETDRKWWSQILNHCLENDRYIIIHSYEPQFNNTIPGRFIRKERQIRNQFLSHADTLSDEQKEKLRNRILINLNQNIFFDEKYMFPKEFDPLDMKEKE